MIGGTRFANNSIKVSTAGFGQLVRESSSPVSRLSFRVANGAASLLVKKKDKMYLTQILINPDGVLDVKIGGLRSLRRDCARLRDRRMSWIVLEGQAAVILSYMEA